MFEAPTTNPAFIDPSYDCRAVTFENPTGARGSGGQAANGRKGAPSRRIRAGERVVLADLEGPGVIRHFWLTMLPAPPERLRALMLEVFYDGAAEPSISVPVVDFFGLPHGRQVPMQSAVMSVLEGRGYNSYAPDAVPRGRAGRGRERAARGTILYYQLDYTLHAELPAELGYLHATFRRENPTTLRQDFVIADGLEGPGPVLRLQRRGAGDRRRRLVRRGRGEGLPRRRRRAPHDLRHRPRGLRRQRVGHGPVRLALQRRAAAGEGGGASRRPDHGGQPGPRRLLPLAPARPDHVRSAT